MATENIQLVRRFFDEMCNNRQFALADQLFSGSHAYADPASPWVGKGPAGMKELIGVYHRGVNDAHWDIHSMLESRRHRDHALDRTWHAYRRIARDPADEPQGPRRRHLDASHRRWQDCGKLELLGYARHVAAAWRGAAVGQGGLARSKRGFA